MAGKGISLRFCLAESADEDAQERFTRARARALKACPRAPCAWLLLQLAAGPGKLPIWALEAVVQDTLDGWKMVLGWEEAVGQDGEVRIYEKGE
jgi:hypothetical protein